MEIIQLKDIVFSYDGKYDALNSISFSVNEGEYISLIGHNGSGKSTIAKLLIGLITPKSGDILINGQKLSNKNINQIRQDIGIVFQNPDNQFIGTTVADDIAFGLENRRVPTDKMQDIIEEFSKRVGMDEYLDKAPEILSGGQKQRVAIAGILAANPKIIILDEATAMLDPKGKKEVYDLINKLRKENKSLVVISITHDIEEAFNSDRVIVLNQGKVLFNKKPNELIENENELIDCGLNIPLTAKLIKEFSLKTETNSLEEIVEKLCQ